MDSETFDKIKELLLSRGYKAVSEYNLNGERVLHFVNEGLEYARISDEDIDQEDLWNILGTSQEDLMRTYNLTNKDFDTESEAYQNAIRTEIEGNELDLGRKEKNVQQT